MFLARLAIWFIESHQRSIKHFPNGTPKWFGQVLSQRFLMEFYLWQKGWPTNIIQIIPHSNHGKWPCKLVNIRLHISTSYALVSIVHSSNPKDIESERLLVNSTWFLFCTSPFYTHHTYLLMVNWWCWLLYKNPITHHLVVQLLLCLSGWFMLNPNDFVISFV